MTADRTYKVPGRFFEDHMTRRFREGVWRDHDRNANERWVGRYVYVTMTAQQVDELLCDAEHYAEGGGGFDPEYRGLIASARATVKALSGSAA